MPVRKNGAATATAMYQKLTQREHVLKRPLLYVGSTQGARQHLWLINDVTEKMEAREIVFIPALHKIFDEVLVNALDHHAVTCAPGSVLAPVKNIAITITSEEITIRNDGAGIPVEMHETEGVYIPEMIFTQLLTGQNFDDEQERTVGGQNGMGAKLANIFSSRFTVETVDAGAGRKFRQTCRDQLQVVEKAHVTKCSGRPYTEVSFAPNMSLFSGPDDEVYESIPDDMIAVFKTRAYQAAMCAGADVKVTLNGAPLNSRTLANYMDLFVGGGAIICVSDENSDGEGEEDGATSDDGTASVRSGNSETTQSSATSANKKPPAASRKFTKLTAAAAGARGIITESSGPRWEYGIIVGDISFDIDDAAYHDAKERKEAMRAIKQRLHQQSFVNGINTVQGGTHLEHARDQFVKRAREWFQKHHKGADIEPAQLKDMFVFFANATIVNPTFKGQTKEELVTPVRGFGSSADISEKFIARVMRGGGGLEARIVEFLEDQAALKEAKTDGKQQRRVIIPDLQDANKAGHETESIKCTLILTEGKSAATFALSGLAKIGCDYFGVFPLKGKVINVKGGDEAGGSIAGSRSAARGERNKEIANLKKILGLVSTTDYDEESRRRLRYGSIMIMSDQDLDGSHIRGLIISLFHTKWRSLLRMGYLTCMVTPIVKAFRGSETKPRDVTSFYNTADFEEWRRNKVANEGPDAMSGWVTKYYKGLGTSTASEARECFGAINRIPFVWDATSDSLVHLAFSKQKDSSNNRKKWLRTFDRTRTVDYCCTELPISTFINNELIHYSVYSNLRAIPHVMDGLKPSQRKVIWAAFRKRLTANSLSIKVAQLAGYISENAAYHHGEKSLEDTIKGLAQIFVGSNNINLLHPQGQFGSRIENGKDAAAARYIFTRLTDIAGKIFRPEDAPVLSYLTDDDRQIEPEFYVPVIPMVLINSVSGIGTGYSSNTPGYNPRDIIAALRRRICGESLDDETTPTPWYDGFRGTIEAFDDHRFVSRGIWRIEGPTTIVVTEIPLGQSYQGYTNFLQKWQSDDYHHRNITRPDGTLYRLKSLNKEVSDVRAEYRLGVEADFVIRAAEDPEWATAALKLVAFDGLLKTSNMYLFDTKMHIHHYRSPLEIIDQFVGVRLDYYGRRRLHQIAALEGALPLRRARRDFIAAVMTRRLTLVNKTDADIVTALQGAGLPALGRGGKPDEMTGPDVTADAGNDIGPTGGHDPDRIESYAYLTSMPQSAVSQKGFERLERELADILTQLERIRALTPEKMWLSDLDELEAAYTKFAAEKQEMLAAVEAEITAGAGTGTKTRGGARGRSRGRGRKN